MSIKKKIIVLEDDRVSSALMSAFLKKHGYEVIESREARSAIELAIKEKPDLMIADIMLPDMNGSDAVKQIRLSRAAGDMQVLFLTSLLMKRTAPGEETSIMVEGKEYRAIAKPCRPDRLCALVDQMIGGPN